MKLELELMGAMWQVEFTPAACGVYRLAPPDPAEVEVLSSPTWAPRAGKLYKPYVPELQDRYDDEWEDLRDDFLDTVARGYVPAVLASEARGILGWPGATVPFVLYQSAMMDEAFNRELLELAESEYGEAQAGEEYDAERAEEMRL